MGFLQAKDILRLGYLYMGVLVRLESGKTEFCRHGLVQQPFLC